MNHDSISNYKSEIFRSKLLGELSVLLDSEGALWFRLPDLTNLLDMEPTASRRVDPEDRKIIKEIKRRGPGTTYVNEPGMYTLILASRKEKAMEVKRWVTHDVLPAIRKYGGYVQGMEKLPAEDRDDLTERLRLLSEEVSRKTDELNKANEGKAKIEKLLIEEEDRNFSKTERIEELLAEMQRLESFAIGMMGSLSSVSFTERYLKDLKAKKLYESHQAEYEKAARKEPAKPKRDPYVKPAVEDPDPIVRDPFGNIGRRSELLARDFK